MSNESISRDIETKEIFENVLNRHGYGFHYSVLKKLDDLRKTSKSAFVFEAAEFPVEVNNQPTRIDFVLRRANSRERPLLILAECKRANPALSNWCFTKAPFVSRGRNRNMEPTYIEYFNTSEQSGSYGRAQSHLSNIYHVGCEVRSNLKGDSAGEKGEAIETACSQISRGLNGFVNTLIRNNQLLDSNKAADILPVIFTTANLWTSDVDLSLSNLETGHSDISENSFEKASWIAYQYHTSPGIKHNHRQGIRPTRLGEFMFTEYVRTIPIISSSGIEDFIKWASYDLDLDS